MVHTELVRPFRVRLADWQRLTPSQQRAFIVYSREVAARSFSDLVGVPVLPENVKMYESTPMPGHEDTSLFARAVVQCETPPDCECCARPHVEERCPQGGRVFWMCGPIPGDSRLPRTLVDR